MIRPSTLIALAAITLTAGCASTGSTSTPSAAQEQAAASPSMYLGTDSPGGAGPTSSVATSQPPPAPTAEPSTGPCLTKACIISDVKQTLVGGVAKDESVLTKMTCFKSTVKRAAPGVWTVHCDAFYSDDTEYAGIASLLVSKARVTWEATSEIR